MHEYTLPLIPFKKVKNQSESRGTVKYLSTVKPGNKQLQNVTRKKHKSTKCDGDGLAGLKNSKKCKKGKIEPFLLHTVLRFPFQ